ncbi:DUF3082 domain-containing protein [Pseudanabaena sp. FACHB-2040]|uniref:DUF3082 domain-containing protein n=1 Tax=Pseudanabaena sp. FACHB-2040 TaxID=2692859 RepID=UPI001682F6B0|nr:DUF3082 domain-containing protein [Pseudanabaena sp. FACHB-2040]MBD0267878.1 DUF3082 domain-containing protein [Cyanobacteria bacterium Co-bin8]MBD2258910.1 DUF3082 domain-containing protein [Pseudanabaena sp. FACHB-2040]
MADTPTPSEAKTGASTLSPTGKILRCFSGAFISGSLAILIYRLMLSIALTFANKPVTSDNTAVINLSSAVRTLVVGTVALGAGVFGLAGLGLFLLGIQLTLQRLFRKSETPSES